MKPGKLSKEKPNLFRRGQVKETRPSDVELKKNIKPNSP